jgi:predicted ATP-grasp superfamily ATP-dependent carboligase
MHHGALGAVRSAGRLGISVFYAHSDLQSPVDSSRYSRGSLTIPRDVTTDEALGILTDFGQRHENAVLLPVDDASAVFIDDHCSALREVFTFPLQADGLARQLANKRELQRLCEAHAVQTPTATFPGSEVELAEHASKMAFPIAVKRIDKSEIGVAFEGIAGSMLPDGNSATRSAATLPSVRIAHDHDELLDAYGQMNSPRPSNVMLQEYIPEGAEANWMFNGYFDAQSECRVAFTGRKLRQSPTEAGATTLGVCEPNPAVDEITRRFMRAVGYSGIVDVDFRFDSRDGQYKLLDVNPRIGSSFRLFVAEDGTDVLRTMYLDLTGQAVPAVAQRNRRRWLVEPQDLQSSIAQFRRGDLTPLSWMRSLRHVDEAAWWARDDPQPFLALSRRLLVSRVSKRLRSIAPRRAGE